MRKLYSGAAPDQVAADIASLVDFQPEGMPLDQLEQLIQERLVPHLMRYDLPGFQSMFNAVPSDEAMLGAQIALEFNQGITNWQVSPGGAMLEESCCQALCRLFGLGEDADATFMYSGTYANQQALYMALHRFAERQGFDYAQKGLAGFDDPSRLAVLVSQDAHFSLRHAVRMLGLGDESLVTLPQDEKRRVDIDAVNQLLPELRSSRDIFCLVATAGTTSTGTIDPINEMAGMAAHLSAWLHVDGAYGYAYKLVPERAHRFEGDELADSITWDPHKQLGAPIPSSVLFVSQKNEFRRMALNASYFNRAGDPFPNPGLKSPPSTRPMSALPLVAILRGLGIRRVIENLSRPLAAIQALVEYLQEQSDVEVLHQPETGPDTGILCFRMVPKVTSTSDLDKLQETLYQQVLAAGERSISITTLDGTTTLRLVVVSPHITFQDLYRTIEHLRELTRNAPGGS